MSEQAFTDQIPKTLAFEGGYGDDPADPGGETNFGISKAAYPDVDIANLTRDDAIDIYHQDYWLHPRIDQLPDSVAGKVFDMAVNMGPVTAIRLWQGCLNDMGANPPLIEDGRIGPATIAASTTADQTACLGQYKTALVAHYMAIIRRNPSMAKFHRGWLRRANA
jgi:lysozyme family protein